jgi:hypothetical protein
MISFLRRATSTGFSMNLLSFTGCQHKKATQQHTTSSGDRWECSERDGDVKLARRATDQR